VTRFTGTAFASFISRELFAYVFEVCLVAISYFALTKIGLALIAYYPNAPMWPAASFGIAAILVRGYRVWPGIFVAAWTGGAPAAMGEASLVDSALSSGMIAAATTVQAVLAGYLINVWSDGRRTFDTMMGVGKFALVGFGPATMIGATVGTITLCLAGYAGWDNVVPLWMVWWLRDLVAVLVGAPVVVLWAVDCPRTFNRNTLLAFATVCVAVSVVGVLVLNPLTGQRTTGSSLGILLALPLLWAALRCSSRDTATIAFLLSLFALWGTFAGAGPFAQTAANGSVLPLVIVMISSSLLGLGVSADIATRQRIELQLRRQEHNLRNMFSQAAVGIMQIDTKGQFKLVNQCFSDIVERSPAQLLQLRMQDLVDPSDLPLAVDLLERTIGQEEVFGVDLKYVLPGGARIWVRTHIAAMFSQDGVLRHLVAVAEDVTASRLAEAELQRTRDDLQRALDKRTAMVWKANEDIQTENERRKNVEVALKRDIAERLKVQEALNESNWRFRKLAQGASEYAMYMLDQDGHITHWNMGAQRIYQYTGAQIVGQHFSRLYTEQERQRGEPARALQVAAYEGKHVAESQRVRCDESLFWAAVVIEPVRDEVGTLIGFVQITRDIADKREAQESLERAREQLAQSQKMEALGHLTGSIAHDFNNLLMIVSGHAQLLRRRLTDPKQLQAIDAMHSAASRGESLTRQLLAFSRRQPLSPVLADLKERVDAVHEMLVGSLRGNVRLSCDIAADVWPVEVDIAELELALINLAVNARDAMPGGGIITLSARNVTLKKSDVADELEGDFIALAMTDTGVGIAPDILPKIFEPFFTTKALGKGTGLGLSQVYSFARQSGGTVVATSAVGSGTTITLYLPRKHAGAIKAPEASNAQFIMSAQGTVLVVEDNADVAVVTASLVEQLGYRTVRAETASDALNRLRGGEKIDLIFSDVVMPGEMNGIALAQAVQNRCPGIPVLLTSGYSDVVQAATGAQFPILRKPFQLPALAKAIREALEQGVPRERSDSILQFPRSRSGGSRDATT
jgi:PAS domain S-box-containing protein